METETVVAEVYERSGGQSGEQKVIVRENCVERVLATVEAEGLGVGEMLVVIARLHRVVVQANPTVALQESVLVQVTAGGLTSTSLLVQADSPLVVQRALGMLLEMASPALWAEILSVLEAPPDALREMFRAAAK